LEKFTGFRIIDKHDRGICQDAVGTKVANCNSWPRGDSEEQQSLFYRLLELDLHFSYALGDFQVGKLIFVQCSSKSYYSECGAETASRPQHVFVVSKFSPAS